MSEKQSDISTRLLHPKRMESLGGSTTTPIVQSSAFAHESAEDLERIFKGTAPGFSYSRLSNPTIEDFQRRMADAEHGFAATACSSGSAAVASALMSILRCGDEVISSAGLYGGTLDFFRDIAAFGIKVVLLDELTPSSIKAAANENTKAVFAETISNPGLKVLNISACAAAAHELGIPLIVDSTVTTPILVHPLDLGADIVVHSSSKYINGSGNSISGVIIDGGKFPWSREKFSVMGSSLSFGKLAFTARLRSTVWRNIGVCLAPLNAYLNILGLETLSIRMEKICSNALALAKFFEERGLDVNYPALSSSGQKGLVENQFLNSMAGGILTLRLGSKEKAYKFINSLKFALNVSNIGDTKTLVVHPSSTIFLHSSDEERKAAGVFDDLVRISVGIENIDDLISDFSFAIKEVENYGN